MEAMQYQEVSVGVCEAVCVCVCVCVFVLVESGALHSLHNVIVSVDVC